MSEFTKTLQTPTVQRRRHRAEPAHRAERTSATSRAMRAARYLLGKGHAPKHTHERLASVPPTPPAVAEYALLNPDEKLRYQGQQTERLQPFATAVAVSRHQPLMSREQVHYQLGIEMGVLQVVLRLPDSQDPLYCFDQSRREANGDIVRHYTFATGRQLEDLYQASVSGDHDAWDRVNEGMLHLHRDPAQEARYNRKTIGTRHWLPGRNPWTDNEAAPAPPEYAQLGEQQASLRIDETGVLTVQDREALQPTIVEFNPELLPVQDPWPNGPDRVFRPVHLPPSR